MLSEIFSTTLLSLQLIYKGQKINLTSKTSSLPKYCPSIDGHLGCFHVLAIVNNAAVNIGVHVSFPIIVFSGYMTSTGIAGSQGSFGFPGDSDGKEFAVM